jgi:hypothetical protein
MRSVGVVVERSFAWAVTEYVQAWPFPEPGETTTFPGMLRADCATAPGMSGGPVVDLDGDLVGVVVGSSGVASPVEAIRSLLPHAAGAAPPRPAPAVPVAPEGVRGADDRPSREATIRPVLASSGVERSLVALESPGFAAGGRRFTAVIVSADGVAVAPSLWLADPAKAGGTVAARDIAVVGHPGARCAGIVAVKGELALIRLSGLLPPGGDDGADGLRPVGPAGAAALGEIVATVSAGGEPGSVGFVTAVARHPGRVAPDAPRWGCGSSRSRYAWAHPPVVVASALAHDAGSPGFDGLIVDRSGRPIAVEVATRAYGLSFAVPWTEVVSRFDAWLRPATGP